MHQLLPMHLRGKLVEIGYHSAQVKFLLYIFHAVIYAYTFPFEITRVEGHMRVHRHFVRETKVPLETPPKKTSLRHFQCLLKCASDN